jgi:hypothetical protein
MALNALSAGDDATDELATNARRTTLDKTLNAAIFSNLMVYLFVPQLNVFLMLSLV